MNRDPEKRMDDMELLARAEHPTDGDEIRLTEADSARLTGFERDLVFIQDALSDTTIGFPDSQAVRGRIALHARRRAAMA